MAPPPDQSKALAACRARHAKPHAPATDDHERPPFAADIREGMGWLPLIHCCMIPLQTWILPPKMVILPG